MVHHCYIREIEGASFYNGGQKALKPHTAQLTTVNYTRTV